MAYKLTYKVNVSWVGPGTGVSDGPTIRLQQSDRQSGRAQIGTFLARDIDTLVASMGTDITAQLLANITRVQNWANGGD